MKVLIATDCAAKGEYLQAGKVYELDSHVAEDLMHMGRAVPAPADEPKPRASRKAKAEAGNGAG